MHEAMHQAAALAGKGSVIVAGALGGGMTMAFGWFAQGQNTTIVIVGVLSTVLAALLANWARIITAKSTAKTSERTLLDTEMKDLIDRLHSSYELLLNDARHQESQQKKIAAIRAAVNHKMQSELQRLAWQISFLEMQLRRADVEPEPFRIMPYDELLLIGPADEDGKPIHADDQILAILNEGVNQP